MNVQTILLVILVFLIALNGVTIWGLFNAEKKLRGLYKTLFDYDEYFEKMKDSILQSYTHLKEIDKKGHFEADDEVGRFFNDLKEVYEILISNTNTEPNTEPDA
jgi:hypothetical protein